MNQPNQRPRAQDESRRVMAARLVAIVILTAAAFALQGVQGCNDSKNPPQTRQEEPQVEAAEPIVLTSQTTPESLHEQGDLEPVEPEPVADEPEPQEVEASEDDPLRTAWDWYLRGLELRRSGQMDSALACLIKTTEMAPSFTKGWINLARVYLDQGDVSAAYEAASRATELDSTSTDALVVFGRSLYNLGQIQNAIDAYEQAISLDDQNPFAHNNLGLIFIEREAFEEALPHLKKAVELRDDLPYFFNNLGIVQERLGNISAAVEAYRKAVEIDSTYEKARANLERVERRYDQTGEKATQVSLRDDGC